MEENRLKPMRSDYDPELFNTLYEKTAALRKKLTSQIDCRRFGVDREEIEAWFTLKFIFVFNKYYDKERERLLGYIINSLQLFKYRILRSAYTVKYSQSIIDISEVDYQNLMPDEDPRENKNLFYDLSLSFMEKHLSENAYHLLLTQLQPPPYILKRMEELGIDNLNKIPSSVLAEYYELGNSIKAIKYVENLRKEISQGIAAARNHFQLAGIKGNIYS